MLCIRVCSDVQDIGMENVAGKPEVVLLYTCSKAVTAPPSEFPSLHLQVFGGKMLPSDKTLNYGQLREFRVWISLFFFCSFSQLHPKVFFFLSFPI